MLTPYRNCRRIRREHLLQSCIVARVLGRYIHRAFTQLAFYCFRDTPDVVCDGCYIAARAG